MEMKEIKADDWKDFGFTENALKKLLKESCQS